MKRLILFFRLCLVVCLLSWEVNLPRLAAQGFPIQKGGPVESDQEEELLGSEQPQPVSPSEREPILKKGAPEEEPEAVEPAPPESKPEPKAAPAPKRRKASDPMLIVLRSIRSKGLPVSAFLDTISAQAKVSFVVADEVKDLKITAFLQDITVKDALQVLLEIKGLTFQRIGKTNTYVVNQRSRAAAPVLTKLYTLNYIPLIPIETTEAEVAAISSRNAPETPAGPGGGQQGKGGDAIPFLGVLKGLMTKDIGSVTVDSRTNTLVITDLPEVFPRIEELINSLDQKAPQVLLEAQIVEVDSQKTQELGIDWGGSKGELLRFSGPSRETDFPLRVGIFRGRGDFFPPAGAASSASGSAADTRGITMGTLSLADLQVLLKALITRGEARFLAKPKVLTLNNKTAIIQIIRDQALSIQTKTIGGAQGLSSSGTEAERQETGVVLRVTPQVNSEGFITLKAQPRFTDVIQSDLSSATLPVFDTVTRGVSTLVRVKDGQTLVLGGLIDNKETKVIRKVPLLGYIPILGWLFTSTSVKRSSTDLAIFITPRIVQD